MRTGYFKTLKVVIASAVFLGCLGLVVSINAAQAVTDRAADAVANQEYFKHFTLKSLDGDEFTQDDVSANKVTVFNGWAPWCTPCTGEMPDLEMLSREYEGTGLEIVGVVADYYQKAQNGDVSSYNDDIHGVIASTGVTYPVVVADKEFYDALSLTIKGYPTTWAVDSEGNIIECLSSAMPADSWREHFDSWLESTK